MAPATYNTINKWAAGIADNYALNQLAELTGLGLRIVVPGEFEPYPPRTGGSVLGSYPWERALAAIR